MSGSSFEEEVRSVARALWNIGPGEGGAEFIDGQEMDCVCRTEDVVHLVECTLEKKLEKVTKDVNKLQAGKRAEERNGNTVKMWIVTGEDPTPEQRTTARKDGVTILSIAQFRGRLLDSSGYLNARWSRRFGSSAAPETGSLLLPEDEYVPLPILDVASGESHSVGSIADGLIGGAVFVLLGPFGAGKSLTIREVFRELRLRHFKESAQPVPVAINLREHWGQSETDEVLLRHARKIGFEREDQLVRAWNAGRLVPLLDGFDEIASQSWRVGPAAFRRTRRDALAVIRSFLRENSGRFGVLMTGREHYFGSAEEMRKELALPAGAVVLSLAEFTEAQARQYLAKKGARTDLPLWLPRKPLLLGYLAVRNLLAEVLAIDQGMGAAFAWNEFLDKICAREAQLTDDDPSAVRSILELLAVKTRETSSGTGPLYESDLAAAYARVTGVEPLESARVLLQRLPGLTARDQEEGARSFVDLDMLEALRGSGVAQFIANPYKAINESPWQHALGELGCEVTALISERSGVAYARHKVAASEAISRWGEATLAFDCLSSGALRLEEGHFDCEGATIRNAFIDEIDLERSAISNLSLGGCWIETLVLGGDEAVRLKISDSIINRVVGVSDAKGLPTWISSCEVGFFDDTKTTAAIMRLSTPLPVRVLLTILKKLFVQRGRGRKEGALFRGLDQTAQRFVSPILEILRSEGLVLAWSGKGETVWHPQRREQKKAYGILSAAGNVSDRVIERVRGLS